MFQLLMGKPIARRADDRAGEGRDHRVLPCRSSDGLTHRTYKLLPAVGLLAANLSYVALARQPRTGFGTAPTEVLVVMALSLVWRCPTELANLEDRGTEQSGQQADTARPADRVTGCDV